VEVEQRHCANGQECGEGERLVTIPRGRVEWLADFDRSDGSNSSLSQWGGRWLFKFKDANNAWRFARFVNRKPFPGYSDPLRATVLE
jgi:hypothetical protein